MKKTLQLLITLILLTTVTVAVSQDKTKEQQDDSVTQVSETEADNEQDATEKEQASDKKGKRPKKAPKPLPTIDEIIVESATWRKTGEADLDKFFENTVEMVGSFKDVSDSINHIKIETIEIEDEGDGVTQAVKITDMNGNARTKEALLAKNTSIVLNLTQMALQATTAVATGVSFGTQIAADPMKALSLMFAVKQIKTAVQALRVLGREIPIALDKVQTQNELLKQMKGN